MYTTPSGKASWLTRCNGFVLAVWFSELTNLMNTLEEKYQEIVDNLML